jgi:EVE domain
VADPAPIAVLRDGTEVAAWMFKANPDVWDVLGFLRSGVEVDSWRMARSYRVELVRPGHPCVLWVTGPTGSAHIPGVWAIGRITGEPFDDVGDPDDHRWRDHAAQRQVRPFVETRMDVLAEPLARAELAGDPSFAPAEILTRPRMGSPLALRAAELAAITERIGSS